MSGPVTASFTRAETKNPSLPRLFEPHSFSAASGLFILRMPCESVVPAAIGLPLQSVTRTCAFGTGLPLSSVVTQTRLFSRPCFKCTPRFVTSTDVRTYIA